jgi:hypothetical protein
MAVSRWRPAAGAGRGHREAAGSEEAAVASTGAGTRRTRDARRRRPPGVLVAGHGRPDGRPERSGGPRARGPRRTSASARLGERRGREERRGGGLARSLGAPAEPTIAPPEREGQTAGRGRWPRPARRCDAHPGVDGAMRAARRDRTSNEDRLVDPRRIPAARGRCVARYVREQGAFNHDKNRSS